MQNLKIENFGAIQKADLNLKDVNIFIGKNAKGKSTIAKVISILSKKNFNTYDEFKQDFKDKNIDFFEKETILELKKDETKLKFENEKLKQMINFNENIYKNNLNEEITFNTYENQKKMIFQNNNKISFDIKVEDFIAMLGGISLIGFIVLPFISSIHDEVDIMDILFYSKINALLLTIVFILFGINDFIQNRKQNRNNKTKESIEIKNENNSIYIPSERSFISLVSNSLFNMIRYDIPIPKFILDFGAEFERALQNTRELKIEFLDITYKFESGEHRIYHSKRDFVKLSESASAIQTLIPMLLTIKYFSTQKSKKIFVIEEPELNLYPIAQKCLVEFLVKECLQNGSKLIVTTHSPYILTAFNNLIQASNTAKEKPNLEDKVEKIISKDKWLNFDRVGAWYVDNGTAEDIMDYENSIIGANKIDDVSEILGGEFDELIELMYGEE